MISIEKQYNLITDKQFQDKYNKLIQQYKDQYNYIKFYHLTDESEVIFIITKLKNHVNIQYLIMYMIEEYIKIWEYLSKNEIKNIFKYIWYVFDISNYTYIYGLKNMVLCCYLRYTDIENIDDLIIRLCNKYIFFYSIFDILIPYHMMYNHASRAAKFIIVYIEHFDSISDEYKYRLLQYMQNRLSKPIFQEVRQTLGNNILHKIYYYNK